jgi:hypothetical protein
MIKTHRITGLKYLCVTSKNNHDLYKGSGIYWKNHIRKYGNNIETDLLLETDDLEELRKKGIEYSAKYDVVESEEWANLIPETGYHKDKTRNGWFGWYNNLTPEEISKRNENISKKVIERYKKTNMDELSKEISRRRISLTEEKKKERKIKIQKTYDTGKHQHLFDRYSRERMGNKNPAAKPIEIDGIKYGCVQDASRILNISAHKLYRLGKRNAN